jgi:hypothetical protein
METFTVGTRVKGGKDADYDTGTVAIAPAHAYPLHNIRNVVWVCWDSSVSTWVSIDQITCI